MYRGDEKNWCHCERAVHEYPENVFAVRCLSTSPAHVANYSFNITLSVSRSRVAFQVHLREWTGLPFRGLEEKRILSLPST